MLKMTTKDKTFKVFQKIVMSGELEDWKLKWRQTADQASLISKDYKGNTFRN